MTEPEDNIAAGVQALGRRVAELRAERGLTQDALATRLGTSWKYLQHIELGRANPSTTLLLRLAAALEVAASELFVPPASIERPRPGRPMRASRG